MRLLRVLVVPCALALPLALTVAAPATASPDPSAGLDLTSGLLHGAVVTTVTTPSDQSSPDTVTVMTTYDQRGNPTDALTEAVDAGGVVVERDEQQWSYDSHGRVVSTVTVLDGDADGPHPPPRRSPRRPTTRRASS